MTLEQMKAAAETNLTDSFTGGIYDEKKDVYVDTDNFAREHNSGKRFGVKITNTLPNQQRLVLHPGKLALMRPVEVLALASEAAVTAGTCKTFYKTEDNQEVTLKEFGSVEPVFGVDYGFLILIDDSVKALHDNGITADGVMRDGVAIQEGEDFLKIEPITGSTVEFFRDFVNENPTRIAEVVINSNDTSMYSNTIFTQKISPFQDGRENKIFLNDFFSENQERVEKITVKNKIPFTNKHVVAVDIPGALAGETVEVTLEFKVGATESSADALQKKAEIAEKRNEILSLTAKR